MYPADFAIEITELRTSFILESFPDFNILKNFSSSRFNPLIVCPKLFNLFSYPVSPRPLSPRTNSLETILSVLAESVISSKTDLYLAKSLLFVNKFPIEDESVLNDFSAAAAISSSPEATALL